MLAHEKTMSRLEPIRILIADDHPVVREGLTALINRRPDMTVVAAAGTGRETVELYARFRPNIALVDLRMPDMDGVDAIVAIAEHFPDARIVVLTTFDGDEDIYRGLRAGAKAYLLKDAPREELIDCIRAVHAGKTHIPPAIAAKLAERVRSSALTARELDVLRLMVAGKSNKEIAAALFVTEGTIKVHVNNILGKLDANGRTEAVITAIRRGIVRLA